MYAPKAAVDAVVVAKAVVKAVVDAAAVVVAATGLLAQLKVMRVVLMPQAVRAGTVGVTAPMLAKVVAVAVVAEEVVTGPGPTVMMAQAVDTR